MIATHLSDDELADLMSGRLPVDRFDRLVLHIDECESCQQRLDESSPANSLATDSFVDVLAKGAQAVRDPVLAEADCQAALLHAAGSPEMRIDRIMPPIETLGPYRLIRLLGNGGMGAVYLAQHNRLRKKVAIKLLPRQHGFDAAWIERFQREMQAVASLSHPGIVTATDAGDVDGWHYLVMEYLDGLDLADIVRRTGPLSVGVAASIMKDVCDALAAVHHAGLVHRDVKPSNIMITRDGSVKLLDLGLVIEQRESVADSRLTTVGHVIGTLAFAAPEQLSDSATMDARADLYAVGATLFQLITGRTPHTTDQGIAPLVIEKTTRPAPELNSISKGVPDELNDLVSELLQRAPSDRPQTADEVATRLETMAIHGQTKSIVAKARRASGNETSGANTGYPLASPPEPPRHHAWKWIAAAGIPMGLLLWATVIVIQMGERTVRIETDDPDIKVAITDSEPAIEVTPLAAAKTSQPQKVFKGKSLEEWTLMMSIERDVSTLIDAMMAVSSLVDGEDVVETQSLLVAARRYGGWRSSAPGGTSSESFMHSLIQTIAPNVMPRPGIDAINNEVLEGNDKSRAAALWMLTNFNGGSKSTSQLRFWAAETGNQTLATQLHTNLQSLIRSGELEEQRSLMAAKELSLVLAIAMKKSMADEHELRSDIERLLSDAKTSMSVRDRLDKRWSEGKDPVEAPAMMPQQFYAAGELGIEIPISIAAATFNLISPDFRESMNDAYLIRLQDDPRQASDAMLLKRSWDLASGGFMGNSGIQDQIIGNHEFWIDALPIITENTTRPDILYYALYQVERYGRNGGGGGLGANAVYQIKPSSPVIAIFKECLEKAEKRMDAQGIVPTSPATPANTGGMF